MKILFWTGVSTIAGALRRRVWIDQKFFQWVPNFYIVFVAPPGIVTKTTTANIGMNLLRDISGIKFGPEVVTWQALVQSLAQSTEAVINPANPMEFHPMSAVTFAVDEFGTFFDPDNTGMVDVLVGLWDGKKGEFNKVTKTMGSDKVENPWINLIGCTTPDWVEGRFPQYLVGGGFTSRCVFLYADSKRQLIPYVDEVVPPNFDDTRSKLIEDLDQIAHLFGEFTIVEEARAWGRSWYESHWTPGRVFPFAQNPEQFRGYMARKQTHIHKLAMVLSAAQNNSMVIDLPTLQLAEQMVSAVEQDMPRVFGRIGQNDLTRGAGSIVAAVEKANGHQISKASLFTQMFRVMSYSDFEKALQSAVMAGLVKQRQVGNEIILHAGK